MLFRSGLAKVVDSLTMLRVRLCFAWVGFWIGADVDDVSPFFFLWFRAE